MEEQSKPPVELKIEMDEIMAQGVFCNLAFISHTETEFTVDFIYVQPQEPKGKVRARIITSPSHAKRFAEALLENIQIYEENYDKIKSASHIPEQKARFLT